MLLTTEQIAQRFGVERRTVTEKWTKRPDFPAPARRISQRLVWWREEDIEAWATGGPRSADQSRGSTPATA